MPFGMWTWAYTRKLVLDGVQISMHEMAILAGGWPAHDRTCPNMSGGQYTQCDSAGGRISKVQMLIGVY